VFSLKNSHARHGNTQWSTANAKAMSLGVSVAGNIIKKIEQDAITLYYS